MAPSKSDRVSLLDRVASHRLTPEGIDLLMDVAEILCEGDTEPGSDAGTYYGTIMLTVDVNQLTAKLEEAISSEALRRLGEVMEVDPRLRRRLVELAYAQTSALCGGKSLDSCDLDIVFRVDPPRLLIDIDVQARIATLAQASEPTS